MKHPPEIVLDPGNSDHSTAGRSAEAHYLRLVEAQSVAKVGSWDTDLNTGIVTWSPEAYRIFNVNPDHFQPTHTAFLELVHPDDRDAVNEAFINSAGSDRAHVIEHRIVHADGTVKFIEERWKTFKNEAGIAVRAVGSLQHERQRVAALARFIARRPPPRIPVPARHRNRPP